MRGHGCSVTWSQLVESEGFFFFFFFFTTKKSK